MNSPAVAYVPDLNACLFVYSFCTEVQGDTRTGQSHASHIPTHPVSEESSEVESISRPETPYSTSSEDPHQKTNHGHATDSVQVSTKRKLIGHRKKKRDRK